MIAARAFAACAAIVVSMGVHAHAGEGPHFAWTLDAGVVVPLALVLVLFLAGLLRVSRRAGKPPRRPTVLFLCGWSVLAIALVSPLHAAGEHSFAAHMLEHELIMLVAAPLLVGARASGVLLWSMPHAVRPHLSHFFLSAPVSRLWRTLSEPAAATLLQAAALWLWHMPVLFDLALSSPGWHIAQHLSFLATALLFWHGILGIPHRRKPMLAIGCLFATAIVSGALGALMALSSSPWYAAYRAVQLDPFDFTPTQDQQIAGLLMWIPGGLLHTIVALVLIFSLMKNLAQIRPRT